MPKTKAKGSAKKRFKISGTGLIRRKHAFTSHKFSAKSKRQKRRLGHTTNVDTVDVKNIKRALGLK